MKAILFNQFGGSNVLTQGDVATPKAAKGEVLIKIAFTSVNPVDWKIREGYLQGMLPHQLPIIPGWDAAGQVVELGEGVTKFKLGDNVFSYARLPTVQFGTYAEYIALPAESVALSPKSLSSAEAAGIPLVGLTAYQAIHEVTKLKAGERLLVTGGAGGVGSLAIQIAKAAGAHVTSTASAGNLDYLRGLGADDVIDYQSKDYEVTLKKAAGPGFDVLFDAVGSDTLAHAESLVKPAALGGRVVSIVDAPKTGSFHFVYPNGSQLATLSAMLDNGTLKAPAIAIRNIKEAKAAQEESATHRGRGKVVLKIEF
jgi:NADPH2:quinone reductase